MCLDEIWQGTLCNYANLSPEADRQYRARRLVFVIPSSNELRFSLIILRASFKRRLYRKSATASIR